MRVRVAPGWDLVHLTDRVIELRKDDVAYRRVTGRDGYVRLRAEPGMDRQGLIDAAIRVAQENDERLGLLIGTEMAPSLVRAAAYQGKQVQMARVFATTDQEPEQRVYRP